jgi:glycosyltransferase involved in cell wall biosynthesis
VVVSPCGEVSVEGLKRKSLKKRSYLSAANAAGLHRNIVWRATSDIERLEIENALGSDQKIFVVPDMPAKETSWRDPARKPAKSPGHLSAAFVARMVPNKNLLHLLAVLQSEYDGKIDLQVIGPHEDDDYWSQCLTAIDSLSSNITVTTTGLLSHVEVTNRLHESHFFILPTKTENFGYAILEAFAHGCPAIISDRTPWSNLADRNFAWILDLGDNEAWRTAVRDCLAMDNEEYRRISNEAQEFARTWVGSTDVERRMEEMFRFALGDPGN